MDKPTVPAGESGAIRPTKPAQPVKKVRKPEPAEQVKRPPHQWLLDYIQSLRYEWFKITFPTRKEWVQATIVVFLFTLILMTVISVYDAGMSFVFSRFILPKSIVGQ